MSTTELSLYSPRFKPAPAADSAFWQAIQAELSFCIIGAPKCGTTWLHTCLRQHSALYLPDEQNFFTLFSQRGPAYYNNLYRNATGRLCGDYSNTYMLDTALPSILAARYPWLKILLVCRNPVQRAFSHYVMDVDKSGIKPDRLSFYQALFQPVTYSYFDLGLYYKHLQKYLAVFPREQVQVVIFEELIRQPRAQLARIFEFLGVEPMPNMIIPEKENTWIDRALTKNALFRFSRLWTSRVLPSSAYRLLKTWAYPRLRRVIERYRPPQKLTIPIEAQVLLQDRYRVPNRRLEEFTGIDLSGWDR